MKRKGPLITLLPVGGKKHNVIARVDYLAGISPAQFARVVNELNWELIADQNLIITSNDYNLPPWAVSILAHVLFDAYAFVVAIDNRNECVVIASRDNKRPFGSRFKSTFAQPRHSAVEKKH
jgi:hypothetical protein